MSLPIDPTRLFSVIVIVIMIVRYLESHDMDYSLIISGFLLHPYVVLVTSITVATLYLSLRQSKPLPNSDKMVLEWYAWNAVLYHAIMDGGTGSLQLVPVVLQQYQILDQRFSTHHMGPWLIGMVELLVMAPSCLATVYAIAQRHPLRWPLEIITSVMHMFGMIVFVVGEVYEGQLNVPALDPVGTPEGGTWANVKFGVYHLVYYWFGFWFCNLVWGVVPYYRIHRGMQECYRAFAAQIKSD